MKLIRATFCFAAVCTVGLGAQSGTVETKHQDGTVETKRKMKIEVKDGKEVTVEGCVARNPAGGFMLAHTDGSMRYALVTDDDLAKHIGHRVEITGKAADRGDGKVKIHSKIKTDVEHGKDHKAEAKATVKGDSPYLGVKSLKMLSASCM